MPRINRSISRSSEEAVEGIPTSNVPHPVAHAARNFPERILHWAAPTIYVVALLLCPIPSANAADELAKHVPADTGLYVEAHDAPDLLATLLDPELWTAVAELAGQPSSPEYPELWRQQIRRAVKMEPQEAVAALAAGRIAFATSPNDPQDAVFISRPATPLEELLKRWQAPPRADLPAPPTFTLDGNLVVSQMENRLVFGVLPQTDGWMRRVLGPWPAGEKSLADDQTYRMLLARTPVDPLAVAYARMDESDGRFLAALHRDGPRLHLTAVTNKSTAVAPAPLRGEPRLIAALPEQTLLAWEGYIDFIKAADALGALPERNPLRIALKMQSQAITAERFLKNLKGDVCFALGYLSTPGRKAGAPPIPAAAIIVATNDPAAAERDFGDVVQSCVTVVNFLCMARNEPLLPERREVDIGRPAAVLDISRVLNGIDDGSFGPLQLCWTVHGDHLIIASNVEWARAVIAAREGKTPGLARLLRLPRAPITPASRNIIAVQTGALADLGQLWLDHLQRNAPDTLTDKWWRPRQPGGSPRLGVDVDSAGEKLLKVISVVSGGPADGRLRVGDILVGAGGKPFATTQPIGEVQTAISDRPSARWLELTVRRGEADENVRIPLPFLNPVQSLRRIVAVGRLAQAAVYHEEMPTQAGSRGYLSLELRSSPAPLLTLPTEKPVGSETAAPARQP